MAVALIGALLITRGLVQAPGFTDAFYHFNAAHRLASGQGFTDEYLWIYFGAPDSLPAPSHLYWMPLTSILAALGMILLNAPGNYAAAQLPFAVMLAASAGIAFWLGHHFGGSRRHAWMAGLLTLTGGFFMRFWGAIDTFVPYALVGSGGLVLIGLALENRQPVRRAYLYWLAVGVLAGLAHLTRADGLLLLLVAWAAVLWPFYRSDEQRRAEMNPVQRATALVIVTAAYGLVMLPWFARNVNAVGSPLPVGGAQAMWLTEYNDLFNYPPEALPQTLFADGPGLFFASRWEALVTNFQTLIAVEGLIVLAPLMLVALWRRRSQPFVRGFWLYALGLHLLMTFVFPFPGMRGGLFHSAAALLPWWMALGVIGLDEAVDWLARRRRHWNRQTACVLFSAALLIFTLVFSMALSLPARVTDEIPAMYTVLQAELPGGARVMINDPARLYYFTGLGGVVLPHAEPAVIPEIAQKYDVDYVVLEGISADGQNSTAFSEKLLPILTAPPDFLTEIAVDIPGVRLYAIAD